MRTKRKYKAGKGGKVKKSDKAENIKEGMGGKVKKCGQSRKYKAGKGGEVILRPLQFPR